MASITTGDWQRIGYYTIRTTQYYTVKVSLNAKVISQDLVNNKSTVGTLLNIDVEGSGSYSADSVKAGLTGGKDISWGYTSFGSNSNTTLIEGSFDVTHKANGKASTSISCWVTQSFGGSLGTTTVNVDLPEIDRYGGNASASVVSTTINSVTLKLRTNRLSSLASYRIDNGSWINFSTAGTDVAKPNGGTINKSFDGFNPNTDHTIDIQFRRDINQVWSSNANVSFKTAKPDKPRAGTVYISEVTPYTAKLSWKDFYFSDGATWGKYQYKLNDGAWIDCGKDNRIILSNLNEGTEYIAYVRIVDNYDTASLSVDVTFTTPVDQTKSYLKGDATWASGKLFYKVNGSWGKVGHVRFKQNGTWGNGLIDYLLDENGNFLTDENGNKLY